MPLRPTTDYCRESLFNILSNYFNFNTLRVLELFAGSGIISLEFASRGCRSITCVDLNPSFIKFIGKESASLEFDFVETVRMDALSYVQNFADGPFDIIYADPPYDYRFYEKIIYTVFQRELLSDKGWLILEHDRKNDFSKTEGFSSLRTYGQSHISVFKH